MTIKVRDSAGALRAIDAVKVRGPDGALRAVAFIKVRGPDGQLRTVFEAGGGGGGANPAYITPGQRTTSSRFAADTAYFTAMSSGTAPTGFSWGVLDGPGTVVSGGNTSTAQLRVVAPAPGEDGSATFYCDVTVDGQVYRALVTFSHFYQAGGNTLPQA